MQVREVQQEVEIAKAPEMEKLQKVFKKFTETMEKLEGVDADTFNRVVEAYEDFKAYSDEIYHPKERSSEEDLVRAGITFPGNPPTPVSVGVAEKKWDPIPLTRPLSNYFERAAKAYNEAKDEMEFYAKMEEKMEEEMEDTSVNTEEKRNPPSQDVRQWEKTGEVLYDNLEDIIDGYQRNFAMMLQKAKLFREKYEINLLETTNLWGIYKDEVQETDWREYCHAKDMVALYRQQMENIMSVIREYGMGNF